MDIVSITEDLIDLRDPAKASIQFDTLGSRGSIDHAPWKSFPYKPVVNFRIASLGNKLLLKFYVTEQEVLSIKLKDNEMVCEDSCVEFFISINDSGNYYNFEFNSIGTALVQYGPDRLNRRFLDLNILQSINRVSSNKNKTIEKIPGVFTWELFLVIPSDIFIYDKVFNFKGQEFKANFYKCGDHLLEPHYLTWNHVHTDTPDFHRPEYFKKILFK